MRLYVGIGLVAGITAVAIGACSAGDESGVGASSSTSSGAGGLDPGEDAGVDAMFGMGGGGAEAFSFAEFCGGGCQPTTGEASPMECEPPPAPGTGGTGGDGDGGSGSGSGGADMVYDCQLGVAESGTVDGFCGATGEAILNQPCLSSSDCAPGLGCVDDGVCRPYCCGDVEACPEGSYCALRSPSETDTPAGLTEDVRIPVCALATMCTLLDGSCGEDLTCTIVRQDGTTSCVEPGEGTAGQGCPCAADHVCATQLNECFKLCKLGDATDCPQTELCQAGGAIYPQGFGICVSQ